MFSLFRSIYFVTLTQPHRTGQLEPHHHRRYTLNSKPQTTNSSMPLATALIVAAAAYQAQKNSEKNGSDGDGGADSGSEPITAAFLENKTSVELLPLEQKLAIYEHPISRVSFYEFVSDSMDDVIQKLESRIHVVVSANPWLGGWLVKGKGVGSFDSTLRLWYDPSGNENPPTIFQKLAYQDVPLNCVTPFIEYETILESTSALVKNNPDIVNRKDEPLFRITIVLEEPNNATRFGLIASMSHICGDGHTFYRILNMILGATPIKSLIPQRELLFGQKVMDLMGRQEAHYIRQVATDPAWMKLFRIGSDADAERDACSELCGRVFTVTKHWIGNIKASHLTSGNLSDVCKSTLRSPMSEAFLYEMESSQNPAQSTNDILTSWFWNLLQTDVGLMAVNLRGRIDGVTEDHVGNYNNPIPYTKVDYSSPSLIRESLRNCRRGGAGGSTTSSVLPRAHPDVTFSVITNWSSFRPPAIQTDGRLDEKEDDTLWRNNTNLIRHVPIIYPQKMLRSMPRRMSLMVIYASGDEVGCVLIAPRRVMEEIDTCGIAESMIAQF